MFIDSDSTSNPLRRRLRDISASERRDEAIEFIKLFYQEESGQADSLETRLKQVCAELKQHGYYEHTYEELCFGARVAWRNHSKCIGRLFWKSLVVRDCRHIQHSDDMAIAIQDHISAADQDGRIQSMISVFPPVRSQHLPNFIESYQIIQYAGYLNEMSGEVMGDKQNIAYTKMVSSLGWKPKAGPTMFDILPFCIREPGGKRRIYELASDTFRQVEITHPDFPEIKTLGLRWYSIPCVSNMILTIGGIDYPCAPFNGFYMGTEIGSRDLCDFNRYNQLENVARAIGCNTQKLAFDVWKDRALTEINFAVLHSFTQAGISIIDHHKASRDYMEFMSVERASGRSVSADWSWIVPPQAASACPVFHLKMVDLNSVPNFYQSKLEDGKQLAPFYGDLFLSIHRARFLKWRRRLRNRLRRLMYESEAKKSWFR